MEVEDTDLENYYKVSFDLVKKAGNLIREQVNDAKNVDTKTTEVDLVTETDKQVEKFLVTSLLQHFPSHKYIGEESVAGGQKCLLFDDPTWIIDPVDGTMNFVHGYPNFCISLGLWINKKPYIGIIYNPIHEQMFTAQKGSGAFLNGARISSSTVTNLETSLIVFEFGSTRDPDKLKRSLEEIGTLIKNVHAIRVAGSAALDMAMVAAGAAEGFFHIGLHIWDIAAGTLLVEEAGGFVCDTSGDELNPLSRRVLCAGTEELARKIIPYVQQHNPNPD